MGIGVEGKASGEVPQHTAYRLDVHTILERDGSESVAKIVKTNGTQIILDQKLLELLRNEIRIEQSTHSIHTDKIQIPLIITVAT